MDRKRGAFAWVAGVVLLREALLCFVLRVRTVAKSHMRSSVFTTSFILVSCVKLP